jgi:hypothetical protein
MSCPPNTPCNPCAECPPAPVTSLPPCTGGEPCDEVSKVDCVSYAGPNLPALGVLTGDRMLSVLAKLHKAINTLRPTPIATGNYTATNTSTVTTVPLVVSYLGLGPVYNSTAGATNSGAAITVGSTTGLVVGMTLEVVAGTGAFPANTTVVSIASNTSFVASQAPSTNLSAGAVIRATGSDHQIFTINVAVGTPQTFKAFIGSPIKVSGTGTIV